MAAGGGVPDRAKEESMAHAEAGNPRRRARRTLAGAALLSCALLAGLALVGCKSKAKGGDTEYERLRSRLAALTPEERQTALHELVRGGGRDAVLAHYTLGNDFYAAAQEGAATAAPGDTLAGALLDSARARFEAAAALDSNFLEVQVNLGAVYDDLQDRLPAMGGQRELKLEYQQRVEQAYLRALAIDPRDEKALCNLGAFYLKKRRHPEALAQFEAALAANPRSALAHYNLAIMFAESKIYREAVREWEAAAAADPHGDIGERSRANIKIIEQMMAAPAALPPGATGGRPR